MQSVILARVARAAWACAFLAFAPLAQAASPAGDVEIRAEPEYQPYSRVEAAPRVRRADPSLVHAVTLAPVPAQQKVAPAAGPGVPLQVGFARDVPGLSDGVQASAALRWRALDSGALVGAMSVTSPGAASLRAGLRVTAMPAGTLVRFYAPTDGEVYEASAEEIQENVGRSLAAGERSEAALLYWSPLVEGSTLVVEVELPAGQGPAHLDLAVPAISHLVTSPSTNFVVPTTKAAASCENDVMCYQGTWANESDATARILFAQGGSSYLCTGTLVVDLDTSTSIPYFLTANHCINSQSAASSIQSYWFYRSTACNSGVRGASVTLSGGATLLYNSATTDTSLVRLAATPPGGAMYAGWSAGTSPGLGAGVTGIHHPHGDLQKISFGSVVGYTTCTAASNDTFSCQGASSSTSTFVDVQWSSGMTEPGSSGSGLYLNNGHYLVGQLYGGDGTSCTDTGTDTYGRFDVAYRAGLYRFLGGTPTGGGGSGSTGGSSPPPPTFTPALNYTALWWNPLESGWGLSINQHSSALFAAWYAYGVGGTPTWLVMPGGRWTSTTSITGDLFATSGPPSSQPYNASQVASTKVGSATISFPAADRAVLSYTVNGVSGTKAIQKQSFGIADATPVASYGDLWWNSSESGWGLSIAQQYRTLFSVLYTYGPYGGPIWYVMPGGSWSGTTYSGPLYRTSSAPGSFYGSAFNPAAVSASAVGTMSIAFSGTGSATLTYSVDGQVFTKPIAREPF